MEMDSGEIGRNGECILESMSDDHPLSQTSTDMNEIFGDPQILPRVGDEYQVQILPFMTHFQLKKDLATTREIEQSFEVGLPIPIIWVPDKLKITKHEQQEVIRDQGGELKTSVKVESERSKELHTNLNNVDSRVKVALPDFALDISEVSREPGNGEEAVVMDIDLPLHQSGETSQDQKYSNQGYSPLPGSVGSPWSDLEVKSFLLGLYIFGKNLVLVKIFVETKEMGAILSYYYGRFYRSSDYCRWSECRKIRSKKSIHGQKIFTGERQRELLSRLLPNVSHESRKTLVQASKEFIEGKSSLEDYVAILKATVGMQALIEAVGIGRGKQDLTGIVDSVKTARSEIPSGNDWNSLSSGEIIKFLTGDFRLSKNRSSELFWDAVWPKLLNTGWQSVEPKNRGYAGSRNNLVFLIPGVKKFSKRKLVKGTHYFDSVTDVLNKIASEPNLLLKHEEETPTSGRVKEENGWDLKFDGDGPSDSRRQRYLQPRNPNFQSDVMKFTVVDTSLVNGGSKVRELRTLPSDTTIISPPTSMSTDSDADSSGNVESADILSNGRSDSNASFHTQGVLNRVVSTYPSECLLRDPKERMSLDNTDVLTEDQENQHANMCNDKNSSKILKCQFGARVKPSHSKYLTPIAKRRKSATCGHAETSTPNIFSVGTRLKEQEPGHLDLAGVSGNMVSFPQEKVCTDSSAKGSSCDFSDGILRENGDSNALSHENVERRPLIDLNLPHFPQDFETGEPFTEMADSQDCQTTRDSSFPVETKNEEDLQTMETSNNMVNIELQPVGRRQSTRNRPLTAKALEALACGYLTANHKGRDEEKPSRPSRRSRAKGGAKGKLIAPANGTVDHKAHEIIDEECSSNTAMTMNYEVWSEVKGDHELLGATIPASDTERSARREY